MRATHCKRGHEFTPDNTVGVRRECRTCRRERARINSRNYYRRLTRRDKDLRSAPARERRRAAAWEDGARGLTVEFVPDPEGVPPPRPERLSAPATWLLTRLDNRLNARARERRRQRRAAR